MTCKQFVSLLVASIVVYIIATGICYLIWGEKGAKLYPVTSPQTEGLDVIKSNKMSYYVKKHYAVFGADIYRTNGQIVLEKDKSLYEIKAEFIEKYGIVKNISFWSKYGIVFMYFIFWIAIFVWGWLKEKGVEVGLDID
jgi:hypothetical protein